MKRIEDEKAQLRQVARVAAKIGKKTKRERKVADAELCCSFPTTSTAFYYHRRTLVICFFCVLKEYAIALVV